jgi:predicted RNA-binding protein associated with RNAse of E/G family
MLFQIVIVFAIVAVTSAHYIASSYHTESFHPVEYKHELKTESWEDKAKNHLDEPKGWEHKEAEKPANYEFKYEVHDSHTGDIKRQSESASHGNVKGQYSLIDSDGYRRVVDYTADPHHGFQATVKREPTHYKVPVPAPKIEQWTEKPKTESWEAKPISAWSEPKAWEYKEAEKPANYEFKYEVHDSHTGDIKRQSESACHGNVKGQYSLIDSDGYRRVVDYTADPHHGFQATVKREPTHYKVPVPAPKIESWAEKPKTESWEAKPISAWSEPKAWEHKSTWSEPKGWEQKEAEKPANYEFKYEVHDSHTGDIKRQSESASHGNVKGQYSLIDSDGYRRVVDYTADPHHGFQATVKREPTHFKVPTPAPKIEEPKSHGWW